jgi:uncharacterized DUF497 family protein
LKAITYSGHAKLKFDILKKHGVVVSKDMVETALRTPEKVESGYRKRKIAQKAIGDRHVIRVVFEDLPGEMRVITFYPGRRERYED